MNFLTVYVKEIHTTDEWKIGENEKDGVCYPSQPRNLDERMTIARDFVEKFHYVSPLAVDGMDNVVSRIYGAWPTRMVLVDEEGILIYKGALMSTSALKDIEKLLILF